MTAEMLDHKNVVGVAVVVLQKTLRHHLFQHLTTLFVVQLLTGLADASGIKDGDVDIDDNRLHVFHRYDLQEPFPIGDNLVSLVIGSVFVEEIPPKVGWLMKDGVNIKPKEWEIAVHRSFLDCPIGSFDMSLT